MAAVYVNGNVYTVDPSIAKAEAFLVQEDGTFGKVGSTAELTQLAKDTGVKVVDLKGQFVMPGMHDAHLHVCPLLAARLCASSSTRAVLSGTDVH
jgi:predicted amidohydrolase YtcJ